MIAFVVAVFGLFATGAAVASADTDLFPGAGRPAVDEGVTALEPSMVLTIDVPADGLAPGGSTIVRHTIVNTSNVALRYSLASASTDPDGKGLRDVNLVAIARCDPAAETALYVGPLGRADAGFGDAATGAQPGDRTLAPGEQASLCFDLRMSSDAGNDYQGATTSTTWTLASEQVAGNP